MNTKLLIGIITIMVGFLIAGGNSIWFRVCCFRSRKYVPSCYMAAISGLDIRNMDGLAEENIL